MRESTARNELEGTDDRAGGEYEAVRLCLLQCTQYCEKIDMIDLELFVRQQISDDADEAELAELRGVKRLQVLVGGVCGRVVWWYSCVVVAGVICCIISHV